MKHLFTSLIALLFCGFISTAQPAGTGKTGVSTPSHYQTPDIVWGSLFTDIQQSGVLGDNKTFADAIPKFSKDVILKRYKQANIRKGDTAALRKFVYSNFKIPVGNTIVNFDKSKSLREHLEELWPVLTRKADVKEKGSSLLPLPHPYVVPGGRFREIYYWDSYFTILGLAVSNKYDLIENMLDNFKYLIDTYGHIPNGNRTYYLSRSQPPFFALMVELLHDKEGDRIYKKYLSAMQKEYTWWMEGEPTLKPGQAYKRVAKLRDSSILNRYWDDKNIPRQESYSVDVNTANTVKTGKENFYKNIRAAAESGWDFSSRWFADTFHLNTIQTTDILPVDLNCLLYAYETILHKAVNVVMPQQRNIYWELASNRKKAILKHFWNDTCHYFFDYNFKTNTTTNKYALAGTFPLFVEIAPKAQAEYVKYNIEQRFLQPGGVTTTTYKTGEQWDAPNGWAPLQYVTVKGLMNYHYDSLATDIAKRWMIINENVYTNTGKMVEKYNVENTNLPGGGGEYSTQDGLGWTNGVYLIFWEMFRK